MSAIMTNKERIERLRDNAELAWASYGYFHLKGKKFEEKAVKKFNRKDTPIITLTDILNMDYNGYKTDDSTFFNTHELEGDFTPTQAKRFFERYDLLKHCPNTDSGFSATLFQNKSTKEFIFAIRGTEGFWSKDLWISDRQLLGKNTPNQYKDMLKFYQDCVDSYPQIKEKQSLTITGHSLGGALAQLLVLSLCNANDRGNIKALYTYNAPGARDLKPPYMLIVNIDKYPNGLKRYFYLEMQKSLFDNIKNTQYKHLINSKQFQQKLENAFYECFNNREKYLDKYYGVALVVDIMTSNIDGFIPYFIRIKELSYNKSASPYYQQLLDNYIGHRNHDYKLSIQDSIYHCESSNNPYKNEWYLGSPISKLGIKLGLNKDNQYADNKILHTIMTDNGMTGGHSIIPLTQTLYFYSYLLESNANEIKDKNLTQTIEYLNKFNQDIKTHTETFILDRINTTNQKKYQRTIYHIVTPIFIPHFLISNIVNLFNKKQIDYLSFFFSIINAKIHKIEVLKQGKSNYIESAITKDKIVDLIISLSKDKYYIKILPQAFFEKTRKQCDYINDKNNIAYKICIEQYQNFILIDKDNNPLETQENISGIYGYNSNTYLSLNQIWEEQCLGGKCKIIQGLYFGGKNKVFIAS
ncbi:lipase family protein [Helicobacter sp. T3_23-1056]